METTKTTTAEIECKFCGKPVLTTEAVDIMMVWGPEKGHVACAAFKARQAAKPANPAGRCRDCNQRRPLVAGVCEDCR